MQFNSRGWWLVIPAAIIPAAIAAVGLTAALGQQQLRDWNRQRLVRQRREQIASLSDRRAARLVLQLAENDDEWIDAIVAAWADPRASVARAGQVATLGLEQRWSALPPQDASPRIARLARLLAQHAPQMDALRREAAIALAQRLLDLPLDGREMDSAQFISDCQSVLVLPVAPPDEIRLAALPPAPTAATTILTPPAELRPLQTPAIPAPPPGSVTPPAPLPDANRERPVEPQRLPAPKAKAIKISDDDK